MYRCERCGKTFSRFVTPGQCPHCKVYASVRCSGCGHTAPSSRFTEHGNRCPKCGSGVSVPGGGGPGRAGQPSPDETCKGCGRTIAGSDWTCPHCGTTRWGMVIGTTVFGLVGIVAAIAPDSPIWLRIVGGLFGVAFLVGISEIWTGLRSHRTKPETPAEAANPNVLEPSPAASSPAGPGRVAAGLMVVALGLGVLGVVWISQIGAIEEETAALRADRNGAALRLTEAESDLARLAGETAGLEEQTAAALAEAGRLDDTAASIEAEVAGRTAAFDAATADEVALATTLVEYERLLLALAELDRDVARALAVVDATYALGVDAGNRRDIGDLESAISPSSLDTLLADLEAALAALEDAASRVDVLPELLPTGEGADD